jgi:hypothetical protein
MCAGPEFIAKALRKWIGEIGVKAAYIERVALGEWVRGIVQRATAR